MTVTTEIRDRIVELRRVPARELQPNPKNWRTHPKAQADAMAGVLADIGYAGASLARLAPDGSLILLDGHLRRDVAPDAMVPVLVTDLDEAEGDYLLATFDPLSAMAEKDDAQLRALLAGVETDSEAVRAMLDDLQGGHAAPGRTDPDFVPAVPEKPMTQFGDLWLMGEHRLLCGDSTRPADVARLMAGEQSAVLWTDPPYGVSYVGGTKDALTMANDGEAGLVTFLHSALAAIGPALAPGSPFYVCHPAGRLSLRFGSAIEEAGWKIHETLVWVKDALVLGHSDYHYRHEPIFYGATDETEIPWFMEKAAVYEPVLYGWTPGAAHPWYGNRSETSVFMIDRPKASREHPTMKPAELVERCLRNSSRVGGIVLDPFLGSGTTLIASDRLGRRCYGMELEPKYADVVVQRWEQFTGGTARRESAASTSATTRGRSTGSRRTRASTGKTKASA